MTPAETKRRFRGFTYWHNAKVKAQYRATKEVLWEVYSSELMNTENIELPSYQTRSGRPEHWW